MPAVLHFTTALLALVGVAVDLVTASIELQ